MIRISAFLLAFLGLSSLSLHAQVTGISYQAVIMSPDGKALPGKNQASTPLANQEICLKFSFKTGIGTTGVVEYEETHVIETDAYGMVNLTLGNGTPVGGTLATFDLIPWGAAEKILVVNLDKTGACTAFTEISKQPFAAVPFALYAVNSPPGPPGPQGPPGAAGAAGPQGPPAAPGTNGLSAYEIWLSLGNTGSEPDFFSSLRGPAGAAGATGPIGPAGAAGTQGIAGNNGLSAYEIWQSLGNTGTVADFIATLRGPAGAAGATGPAGPAGPAGADGAAGIPGTAGVAGPQGPPGPAASTAVLTGATGLPLTTGVTGILAGANGGTGVANTGKTITLGGNLTTSGVFPTTLTSTAATSVTLPTSGTLYGTKSSSITSAELLESISDETGTGLAVFANSPTLVTPNLGTPSAGILTFATELPLTTGVTGILAGANGGTGVANIGKTITLEGNISTAGDLTTSGAFPITLTPTATTSVTLPTTGTLYGTKSSSITSAELLESISDETGTGNLVFSINPALERPMATLLIGNSATPPYTPGTNVTSATLTGTNLAGTIEIVHNGSGSGNEDLVTVTYVGTPFDNGSYPILYPANPATAALTGDRQVFAVGTVSGFKIKTGIDRPFANTYKWNYHVIGN